MTKQMCLFTAPLHGYLHLCCWSMNLLHCSNCKSSALLRGTSTSSPESTAHLLSSFRLFLSGTTFQPQPACFSNLQAATAAIDLAKFTELNKRLTPLVVNGKWGHSWKLYETVGDKAQYLCPFLLFDLSHLILAFFYVLFSFLLPILKSYFYICMLYILSFYLFFMFFSLT